MSWKETYTKIFLKSADIAVSEITLKEYMPLWWQNTREKESGGLRLTEEGFNFVREKLDLEVYEVPYPIDFSLTTNVLIWLDNFIDCPYFLGRKGIFVTSEKKSMELHLFSGDIRKYGLIKAMKRQSDES